MPHRFTSAKTSFLSILKWQVSKRFSPYGFSKPSMLEVERHETLPKGNYALWLGHASVWLTLGETTVAIDPVFGNIPLFKRLTPLPVPPEALKADLILITHAHYDHFDKPSVLALLKANPDAAVVAPAGFWRYMKRAVNRERCFELEWWESLMVKELFITLVPARHWSKRTPFDTNKALWGGYVIQKGEHTLYHAGDTAYGDHFKEIAERFAIDEAFVPIGAYRPEYIMKHNHTDPAEALRAGSDLRAKTLIPIHYGTFRLSDEPLDEPLQWFNRLIGKNRYPFTPIVLRIGEIYRFDIE